MFERKEGDALPWPDDLWTRLSVPWRACVDLAWEAYQAGSLPIGAVVAGAEGKVLSRCARGRDRIRERSGEDGYLFGNKLAHADLNALATLDNDGWDPVACTLYTTTEPCPLCVCGSAHVRRGCGALRRKGALGWLGSHVRDRALTQT
jgi:tRNA(Arg) A34 adenosine deaminase TadA